MDNPLPNHACLRLHSSQKKKIYFGLFFLHSQMEMQFPATANVFPRDVQEEDPTNSQTLPSRQRKRRYYQSLIDFLQHFLRLQLGTFLKAATIRYFAQNLCWSCVKTYFARRHLQIYVMSKMTKPSIWLTWPLHMVQLLLYNPSNHICIVYYFVRCQKSLAIF